ncbi:MAG TPA: sugar ABC transporter substrate-binding protein [bacterium]|nr:sugar ABC transporter substrate-binding protein [bacterium]
MRRSLVALVMVLLLTSGVRAAGPQARIEFWTISLQPFFTKYIQGLIDGYERAHPEIAVHWIDIPAQAIEQKLLAAVAGGVSPDVVNLNTEGTLRMAEAHALVDVDAAVPAAARALYFPNIWDSTRYEGKAYGIPWYVVPNVLAYNRSLFHRAGLDPAHPPGSEDAFIRAATTIKERTGVYGFMPNVDGIRFLKVFQEDGLPILSPDRRHAVFDSPAHARLLATYVALFKRDLFPSDTLQRGYLGATERYAAGQLGMLTTGPQFLLRVRSDSPDVYRDTAVAPYPLGRARVLDLPTMELTVPLASRHPREAVDFGLYATNDRNQLAFSHLVVIFPSTRAAAADPFFTHAGVSPEDRARVIAASELGVARDLTVVVPHSDELFRVFREAVERAFYGRMTPRQAMDWAVKEWNGRL